MQIIPAGSGSAGAGGGPTYAFTFPGNVTTTDAVTIPWMPGRGGNVSAAFAQVKTAPVGAAMLIPVRVYNGVTGVLISTLGTLTIPAGSRVSNALSFASTPVPQNQSLAIEPSQVGSTTSGADLTVQVY